MSHDEKASRRPLTEGEQFVLEQIQDMYGNQNTLQDVFISDNDEAAIFVKDINGTQGLVAVLTNLASMYQDGTISSVENLRNEWLCPP
jgi:TPR repeat protein